MLCLAPSPHPRWDKGTGSARLGCAQLRVSPYPTTPTGHGRFYSEPRVELLAPTLEEAKGWECTPGDTGLQLPCHEWGLHGHSKLHQHPAPLWDMLPAQPHQHPHHGTQLASLLENEQCMGDASAALAPALGEKRCASLRSRVQEAFGTPKATLGPHPSISAPAGGSSIFPPSCVPAPVAKPRQRTVPMAVGGDIWMWRAV